MALDRNPRWPLHATACLLMLPGVAGAADAADPEAARLEALQQKVSEQVRRIDELKRAIAAEEAGLNEIRRALGRETLARQRGGTDPAAAPAAQGTQAPSGPVGQAPTARAPEVAPIFEQPGVLTPRGRGVLEPSLQYSYSSSNRIALVGYTVIPAILIGVIDVREVKRNTFTAALTGRYGLTNRLEVEARVPLVARWDTSVGREILEGEANNSAFNAKGSGVGDVELAARYQFNDGGVDKPYFVGGLRLKTRTGKDPFEVETSTNILGLRDGVQTSLPTGSGFYALQPSLSMLYPSDPAVFFGSVSYVHNVKRKNVTRITNDGVEDLGTIAPGGVFGFNFGMGLALNERSSFSIGYDHASVGKTKQNGQYASDAVRIQLGTLLLGYSYRLDERRSLNVSLGAGLTRDTPDVTLTVRMPTSF